MALVKRRSNSASPLDLGSTICKRGVIGEQGCKSGSQRVQKKCKRGVVGEKGCKSGSQRVQKYVKGA